MTPRLDLDAIEARANAATKGPWVATDNFVEAGGEILAALSSDNPMAGDASNDSQFIAAARSDVPALVARVRELEDELDRQINGGPCKKCNNMFHSCYCHTEST